MAPFSGNAGTGISGSMADNGAITIIPSTSDQAVAAGYHNGSGTVVGDTDLTSGNIVSGKNIFGVTGSADVATSNATAADVVTEILPYFNT
ncbi:MAG: hypothetical protein U9R57_17285 [Thermodesulfobacteriota bacterium]|nr:hypothetical protein [Thermodesulfobacteriota bacterium]